MQVIYAVNEFDVDGGHMQQWDSGVVDLDLEMTNRIATIPLQNTIRGNEPDYHSIEGDMEARGTIAYEMALIANRSQMVVDKGVAARPAL